MLASRALAQPEDFSEKTIDGLSVSAPGYTARTDCPGTELLANCLLTAREKEVSRLCMRGLSVTRISREFEKSLKTISAQKLSAYRKLKLNNDLDFFEALSSLTAR